MVYYGYDGQEIEDSEMDNMRRDWREMTQMQEQLEDELPFWFTNWFDCVYTDCKFGRSWSYYLYNGTDVPGEHSFSF